MSERTVTISSIERKGTSVNGNPRYRVFFTDRSSALTAPDAQVNYGITNPEFQGVPVVVTFSAGAITHVRVATETDS